MCLEVTVGHVFLECRLLENVVFLGFLSNRVFDKQIICEAILGRRDIILIRSCILVASTVWLLLIPRYGSLSSWFEIPVEDISFLWRHLTPVIVRVEAGEQLM